MCNCKKCCASLVAILYTMGYSHKRICEVTGYKSSSVGNIISRRFGTRKERGHIVRTRWGAGHDEPDIIDAIETEYLAGASMYELAEKYGRNPATISKWMVKLGHRRGCGRGVARDAADEKKRKYAHEAFVKRFEQQYGDAFEYLGGYTKQYCKVRLRCKACGHEFDRVVDWKSSYIKCERCVHDEAERHAAARIKEIKDREAAELEKDKICAFCGEVFHSKNASASYCSDECRKRRRNQAKEKRRKQNRSYQGGHRKRARKYGVEYTPGITLKKVYERDGGVCQICGERVDYRDRAYGVSGPTYPSIDHIIAMKNGGGHTWDNVQLAHVLCNSYKRDLR